MNKAIALIIVFVLPACLTLGVGTTSSWVATCDGNLVCTCQIVRGYSYCTPYPQQPEDPRRVEEEYDQEEAHLRGLMAREETAGPASNPAGPAAPKRGVVTPAQAEAWQDEHAEAPGG
jgi:hypothetical protein